MKTETKQKKADDPLKKLEKRLEDLVEHHNAIMDQIGTLALDLQVYCKKNRSDTKSNSHSH